MAIREKPKIYFMFLVDLSTIFLFITVFKSTPLPKIIPPRDIPVISGDCGFVSSMSNDSYFYRSNSFTAYFNSLCNISS